MALSFVINQEQSVYNQANFSSKKQKKKEKKTAYFTHFLASKALQQPVTAVPSLKRDSRVIQKRVDYRQATTPSGSTSNIIKHEHLPSISRQHQVASVGRQHSINDFTLKRAAHLLLNYSRVPQPTNKSKPITMTTARKAMPTRINEFTSQSTRSHSSDSNKRVRKFWWSPKRNEIEIRSDHDMAYKNVTSKVDSLSNLEYRPGGGQVSIRDEPVQWQASPKVNSFANASWAPPAPTINIRKEKVQWNAQPKVDSLSNIDHKPAGGGNIAIRDEKLDLSHVTPRVDCGFVE